VQPIPPNAIWSLLISGCEFRIMLFFTKFNSTKHDFVLLGYFTPTILYCVKYQIQNLFTFYKDTIFFSSRTSVYILQYYNRRVLLHQQKEEVCY